MSIIPSQKLALAEGTKLNFHNVKSSDPERRNQWSDSSEYATLSTLGYGEASTRYPRAPRFDFEEVNQVF